MKAVADTAAVQTGGELLRYSSFSPWRVYRVLTFLFLAVALLTSASPASADGRPQPIHGFNCTFEGATPEPNSSQAQVRAVSIAFRCFDGKGNQIIRLFDAEFFVDGVARDFQRAGEFGTEILFVEFLNGLTTGTHTARVVVEGKASFAWSFRVTSGGASHHGNGSSTSIVIASASAPGAGNALSCARSTGRPTFGGL